MELIYKSGNIKLANILNLSLNINDYIQFFCIYGKEKSEEVIDLKKCPSPDENYSLRYLSKFIDIVIKNEKLYFPYEKFIELIEKLSKSYSKIKELKSIFDKYRGNYKTNKIIEKLDKVFHETGKIFIESNKLDNLDIITFIQEDAKVYYKEYENEKNLEYTLLIDHLNLDKIDDHCCTRFNPNNYNYKNLMKKNYNIFVNAIVSKAKTFRHIKILYKLFNINKFNILNEENQAIIWELVSVFKNKILTEDYDLSEINKTIAILVKLISKNNDFLNTLLEGMKINFSKNDLTQIITNILNKNIHEFSDNTIDVFLKAINLDDNNNLSNKTIILLLYKFKGNVRMEKHILEGIKNDIKEQDIFNIKFSESLELIMKLIDDGFFIGKYNEVNYIKKTIKFMNILKEKLENFIFSMEELKLMYQLNNNDKDGNNLSKRLRIISLGNKNVYNHLSELLIKSINYFHVIYENIKIIINIFSNYYPNEKEEIIKKYQEIIEYINVNPINKFPKNIENFEENCNLSKELYKLKNSKVFIIIYDLFKNRKSTDDNKSDSILINQVKNEFKNLKNLFYDGKDKEMDVQLLEDILKKLESNELKKEIVLLSNILNIKFDDLVIQKIQLLKKKESNIKILKKIILLLNDFEFKDNKIKIILEKSKEDLENISTLGKLIEIDKNLLELNLNILNSSKNEKSLEVINKMYEKPELMAFLKDKTINDIHQMGEFIDDSEEVFITIKDITYLEGCKKFTEDLEKYTENEEKFLNEFMNKVEKNKTIYLSFSNSSSKYHNFNELYSKYLNPNEMNKKHIKSIYQSSIFKLQLSNSSYECVVLYEINKKVEKDFEEILELREIALLRKKDQTEEIYFTICEKFANIVNEIQEILDILNNIASKGYFENLEYIIEIKEGESFGFKSNKNCNDIINKNNLKKLLTN